MKEYSIGKNEAGQRLDKYLCKILKEAPVSFFYKMMRKKNIVLNGKKCTGKEMLTEGDQVKIFLSDDTFDKFQGTVKETSYPYIPLDIVYEDEDYLFVNKPSGMLTQKADNSDVSLNEYIIGYLLHNNSLTKKDLETFKPSVCNRLDRNTSGLVLAGKSLKGLQELSRIIKDRSLEKYYYTVVSGKLEKDRDIEGYLIKDEKNNKVSVKNIDNNQFDEASLRKDERYIRTGYHPLKITDEYTVLEVHLYTGRPHQIRAHLASIGHPVIGDYKYGNKKVNEHFGLKDQLLHARRVVLPDGREFTAELPKEFLRFV